VRDPVRFAGKWYRQLRRLCLPGCRGFHFHGQGLWADLVAPKVLPVGPGWLVVLRLGHPAGSHPACVLLAHELPCRRFGGAYIIGSVRPVGTGCQPRSASAPNRSLSFWRNPRTATPSFVGVLEYPFRGFLRLAVHNVGWNWRDLAAHLELERPSRQPRPVRPKVRRVVGVHRPRARIEADVTVDRGASARSNAIASIGCLPRGGPAGSGALFTGTVTRHSRMSHHCSSTLTVPQSPHAARPGTASAHAHRPSGRYSSYPQAARANRRRREPRFGNTALRLPAEVDVGDFRNPYLPGRSRSWPTCAPMCWATKADRVWCRWPRRGRWRCSHGRMSRTICRSRGGIPGHSSSTSIPQLTGTAAQAYRHRPTAAALRVVEKVGRYLLEPAGIDTPDGLVARDRGDDADWYLPGLADASSEFGDVDRRAFRGLVAAGQLDQVSDEGLKPGDLVVTRLTAGVAFVELVAVTVEDAGRSGERQYPQRLVEFAERVDDVELCRAAEGYADDQGCTVLVRTRCRPDWPR
jgi:hypothetical protein